MESPEYNTIEDLVFDPSFQRWVLRRDTEKEDFWNHLLARCPEKSKLVKDAKAIIYALQIENNSLSDHQINSEIGKILAKLQPRPIEIDDFIYPQKRNFFRQRKFYGLAMAMILTFIITQLLNTGQISRSLPLVPFSQFSEKNNMIEIHNESDTMRLVLLPDGSKAFLENHSLLRYIPSFAGTQRKVFLSGEAFFDIKRDVSKPFFVFTNHITTKVLGTSFRVRAYEADRQARVMVQTGKVSVFKTQNISLKESDDNEQQGIVVTPNQQIVYSSNGAGFVKTLAENPAIIKEAKEITFSFDSTPIIEVFKIFEEAYRIPIIYDEEIISSCSLSANLGNETFFDKLKIVCSAINANYEMMDGNIVITSKGCK